MRDFISDYNAPLVLQDPCKVKIPEALNRELNSFLNASSEVSTL
jgi:hypothetical protein